MTKNRVTAAVLIIENEILSGRTQDTNLNYLAKKLNEFGIQILESRVVPDAEDAIIEAVNALRVRFDDVFTTGGIGPTHDDITADCIAKAFGVPLIINEDIAAVLRRRVTTPDVMDMRMRMAHVPQGGGLIDNPTGPHGFYRKRLRDGWHIVGDAGHDHVAGWQTKTGRNCGIAFRDCLYHREPNRP